MGKTTIEWCEYTFNPWICCDKVSGGCKNCYAESFNKRYKKGAHWGADADRWFMGDNYWQKLRSWDDKARRDRQKARVFVASHSDIFEIHKNEEINARMNEARTRLFAEIYERPFLVFLLLTKRPENVQRLVAECAPLGWQVMYPANLMILTSVENQEQAEIRIPELLKLPAVWRGLSCEPLLEPVDLSEWLHLIHWVIVGGESGPKARPMASEWPKILRDQCQAAGVPFFFKQWGAWLPLSQEPAISCYHKGWTKEHGLGESVIRLGKKETGRKLSGVVHDSHPFGLRIIA